MLGCSKKYNQKDSLFFQSEHSMEENILKEEFDILENVLISEL